MMSTKVHNAGGTDCEQLRCGAISRQMTCTNDRFEVFMRDGKLVIKCVRCGLFRTLDMEFK